MNWKDTPHLFANGKFDAQCLFIDGDRLTGHINSYDAKRDMLIVSNTPVEIPEIEFIIARPISDMTDEEIEKTDYFSYINPKESINNHAKNNCLLSEDFLYLLSIGVYPFEDETDVIFKSKNEE